jgi:hypothetical protein
VDLADVEIVAALHQASIFLNSSGDSVAPASAEVCRDAVTFMAELLILVTN